MDVTITVNFWFLFCACLISLAIGIIIGVRTAIGGRNDRRYY